MQGRDSLNNGLNKSPIGKKKVGFMITKGVWGGAQKYVYELATSLPKDRFEVFVICGQGKILKEKLNQKNIRVYELEKLKRDFSLVSAITLGMTTLRILYKEKPDILHLNSPKAAGIGSVAGRLLFIRNIILTVHGWSFNEEKSGLWKSFAFVFSIITSLFCHKIIVLSEKERSQTISMPLVSRKKIHVVHNGIEKISFVDKDISRNALLSNTTNWEDKFVIGTVAELHKNKGLEYCIQGLTKLDRPYIYLIIGEGEERENLEKTIKHHNLIDKVFLLGFRENATELLKAFDIFVLPSTKEGLPYTLLEAGSAGLPMISTSVGGIPEIIDTGKNGILVTPKKPGEITRALEYLIDKPEERKLFGEKIKEKIEKEFSFDQMLEKTMKLYKS